DSRTSCTAPDPTPFLGSQISTPKTDVRIVPNNRSTSPSSSPPPPELAPSIIRSIPSVPSSISSPPPPPSTWNPPALNVSIRSGLIGDADAEEAVEGGNEKDGAVLG